MIERWGGMVVRRAVVVLLVGLGITAAAMFAGVGLEDKLSSGGFDDPSSESAQELTKERDAFGNRSIDAIAIFTSEDQVVTDPAFQAELEETLASVPAERVSSMATFYDTQDPAMVSHDEHATAVYISFDSPNQESYQNDYQDAYREIRPILEDSALDVDFAGPFAVYSDVNEHTKDDLLMAEIVSLPIVLLLSLIIFRSVTAALMPVLVGLVTVLGARAAIAGLNEITEVSIFAPEHHHLDRARSLDRLRVVRGVPVPRGDRADTGRHPARAGPHDGDRRPHGDVLRADRRRRDELAAGLPAGVPQVDRVRRHRGRPGRDGGRADSPAGDARAAGQAGRLTPDPVPATRRRR